MLIFIYMLPLPIGQTGEAWGPSKNHFTWSLKGQIFNFYFVYSSPNGNHSIAWLMKRCGYGEEHLTGAATTAIITPEMETDMLYVYVTSNVFSKLVFYLQTITESSRDTHDSSNNKKPLTSIFFFYLLSPTILKNYITWSINDETRFYVRRELHKPINYYHLSLNLWSYKYCGIRKACLLFSRHWFGQS
jgi:hypothetical protein